MARLYTGGAEWNDATADGVIVGSSATSTTTVRSGARSWHPASLGSTAVALAAVEPRTCFCRVYFNIESFGAAPTTFIMAYPAGSPQYNVLLNPDGTLQFRFNTSAIGSPSSPVSLGTWYRAELSVKIQSGANDDSGEFRLNGVTIAREVNQIRATTLPSRFHFGDLDAAAASLSAYFDDVAINDDIGVVNNSWPGDSKIVLLLPVADNARVGWTNAAGGTTTLFNDVDNLPPLGVAVPAAQPSAIKVATANVTDTYDANIATPDSAGVGPYDTINSVILMANHGYAFAGAATLGLQGLSNPVLAEVTSSTDGSAAGTYPLHWSWLTNQDLTNAPSLRVGVNPVLRVRHGTSSNSRVQMVDAMGILVDFTPQAGGTNYQEVESLRFPVQIKNEATQAPSPASFSNGQRIAQTFTPDITGDMTTAQFFLATSGTPDADIPISIATDAGGGVPGVTLASGIIPLSSVGASYSWVSAALSARVFAGQVYWLILSYTGAGGYKTGYSDGSGGTDFVGGDAYKDTGAGFDLLFFGGQDFNFRVDFSGLPSGASYIPSWRRRPVPMIRGPGSDRIAWMSRGR